VRGGKERLRGREERVSFLDDNYERRESVE
jgi:hypothetical protein